MCGWPTFYYDFVIAYFEISKFLCEGEECATLKKKDILVMAEARPKRKWWFFGQDLHTF